MDRFLSIVEDSSQETEIKEEKLNFFTSKVKIRDYFGITQQKFLSSSQEEKAALLKKYYYGSESRQSSGNILKFAFVVWFLLRLVFFNQQFFLICLFIVFD